MKAGIYTIDDFDFDNKTVLCRIDINQPIDKQTRMLKSTSRIEACLPTLRELSEKGAKLVLLAHQGSDIEYHNYYSTEPHARVLSQMLNKEVKFLPDICGPAALNSIRNLNAGEILMLDNVRFMAEEQTLFEMKLNLSHEEQAHTQIVKKLAPLADLYICDAFAAAHRNQPSMCGFEQVLPSAMGRLFEREYSTLTDLMEKPEHPCVFVLGGAKIADAFSMMGAVLEIGIADCVLTGGLVSNIILASQGADIGMASLDFIIKSSNAEYMYAAGQLYDKYKDKIILPVDFAYELDGTRIETDIENIPQNIPITDIGTNTVEMYQRIIRSAGTVFVNGPMGVFEKPQTEAGTKGIWDALGDTGAFTIVGGGDSIAATEKYKKSEDISYICTGGGALIRFLSGEELPALRALRYAAEKRKNCE